MGAAVTQAIFPPGINKVFQILIDFGLDIWEQSLYICNKENYHNKFKGEAAFITLQFEVCLWKTFIWRVM